METILGKQTRSLSAPELARVAAEYDRVLVDLGTGDGRFVLHAARGDPRLLAVGVDACRENLRETSRTVPGNALFAIANVLALPEDLGGLADRVTLNFPWGSLLDALLCGDPVLLCGLQHMFRPGARVEVRLNASALAEVGWTLAQAGESVRGILTRAGLRVPAPALLNSADLRALPSTWARKMAAGRNPEAVVVHGRLF